MGKVRVFDGTNWRDASDVRVFDGTNWQEASRVLVFNGTSWVEAWVKSDPITRSFYPQWSWAYHGPPHTGGGITATGSDANGAKFTSPGYALYGLSDGDILQGNWSNNAYDVGSLGLQTGLIGFEDKPANEDGITLQTHLATRPNITSATLRLTSKSTYTDSVKVAIGTFSDPGSAPATFLHTDTDKELLRPSNIWDDDDTFTLTLTSTVYDKLETQMGIALHTTDHNESANTSRGVWEGYLASTARRPLLTVTMDYL